MIFISYSREDVAWAARVTTDLRSQGLSVARDRTLVQGDPFWRRTVHGMLGSCQRMVVLWSRHSSRSPWVDQEIRSFHGEKYFIRLDDTSVPESFGESRGSFFGSEAVPAWLGLDTGSCSAQVNPSFHPDVGPACSEGELPNDPAPEVYRHRRLLLAAEMERLERFRRNLGKLAIRSTQLDERTMLLEDGSRLRRIPDTFITDGAQAGDVYVSTTPVTNQQYRCFVEATGYPPPPTWEQREFRVPDAPVVGVTWFEAKAYAFWADGDLPTREEWERAASAGDPQVEYATQDGRLSEGAAHYDFPLAEGAPLPSNAYSPNPLGFYGMCGNTWDWCSSCEGPHRMICGGGFMDSDRFCRVQAAYRNAPIDRDCCVGFRVKLIVQPISRR
ncbi:MAG TPA: SUMF1/EgtB/PvdO family nonheme iron enzyme [Longimicrobiaceae bacterium]|nr:SUMF1/EgtB/PvdO family nonheme iron enzyme [Longimicrobiaceae bacterium]